MSEQDGARDGQKSAQPASTPSIWRTMRKPKWIAVLLFALAVASAFAWLGQWQLSRAVQNAIVVERDTETARPLTDVAQPGVPLSDDVVDTMVSARGAFVPGDFVVVSRRVNEGDIGFWVVGRFALSSGPSVAVAQGWTPDRSTALSVASELNGQLPTSPSNITGRLTLADPLTASHETPIPGVIDSMAPAYLINVWPDAVGNVYVGFIVSHTSVPSGLVAISSPEPQPQAELNWLNLFYAAEWVIFAGFALFLWWRLLADDVRREREDRGLPA